MVFFLIPVYNEEKNIPGLFKDLSGVLPDEEKFFLFSDDGSSDGSKEAIANYFSNLNYKIIGGNLNKGPGKAFNDGFNWIIKSSTSDKDIVVTLEADCTSDLSILPRMIALNRFGYSLVLASVYARGGAFEKTSFFRKTISTLANLLFRLKYDVKVLTLSSFYRCYNLTLLKNIQKRYTNQIIEESGFICMPEILLKAIQCGAKIIEVPVTLYSSKSLGNSKMKIIKTTFAYLRFLVTFKMHQSTKPNDQSFS